MTDFTRPALAMVQDDISVIPCNADKKASILWKIYQNRRMTEKEILKHFKNAVRLATVCGEISGNLEYLDFDDPKTFEPFLELLASKDPSLVSKLPKRQTPSGGYHILYRCDSPVQGNLKLACDSTNKVRIETRGEGGYALAPPSPGYTVIDHSTLECPVLTKEQVALLHNTAKTFDLREQGDNTSLGQFKNNVKNDRPGDLFNQEHPVSEMLEKYEWRKDSKTTSGMGFTRPGKKRGTSGVLLADTGKFYCWSSNAFPLEPEKSYNAFALFVAYEHGGDYSAAARSISGLTKAKECEPAITPRIEKRNLVPVNLVDFLALEFPPRENLLSPWLPSQGLTLVYAARGIGKTYFALCVAYAVCSGGAFLGWQAPAPVGVMYIDGEMPGTVMQERLSTIVTSNDKEQSEPFILLTPDLQPEGLPRINTEEGQEEIERTLTDDIKLIIIDNISTLSGAKENEADGWTPIQAWALRQRAVGRSILFVHHSGKGGQQRGTSRREDVLDTVISLRRPIDYQPDQGAVFEVHFEKSRGIYGDDVKPIEATLRIDESGSMAWVTRTVEAGSFDRVVQLLNEGMKQNEIAVELGLHKSNVSRHAKKAKAEGLLSK